MTTRYSQSVWQRRWTNLISNVNCSGHEDTIKRSSHNLQHNSLPNHIPGIQCTSKYDRPCVIYVFVKWENFQWFTVSKIQQKSIKKVLPLEWFVVSSIRDFTIVSASNYHIASNYGQFHINAWPRLVAGGNSIITKINVGSGINTGSFVAPY